MDKDKFITISEALTIARAKIPSFSEQGLRRYIRSAACQIATRRSSLGTRAHYELNSGDFAEYLKQLSK